MTENRRRYALIGTGHRGSTMWGKDLLTGWRDSLELVALCDINPLRAERARNMRNRGIGGNKEIKRRDDRSGVAEIPDLLVQVRNACGLGPEDRRIADTDPERRHPHIAAAADHVRQRVHQPDEHSTGEHEIGIGERGIDGFIELLEAFGVHRDEEILLRPEMVVERAGEDARRGADVVAARR